MHLEPFPEKDDRDFGYRVAKPTMGAVPFAGPYLQEVLGTAIGLPSAKRQAAWFKSIGKDLLDVCKRVDGLTPEALGQNEEFQSVVATATGIAMRNHRQEKLEALRKIVIHTAEGFQIDEVLRNTFLALVDRLSPLHIALLKLHETSSDNPELRRKAAAMTSGGFLSLVVDMLPGASESVLQEVDVDLVREGLTKDMTTTTVSASLMESHTTERGKAFLRFIS